MNTTQQTFDPRILATLSGLFAELVEAHDDLPEFPDLYEEPDDVGDLHAYQPFPGPDVELCDHEARAMGLSPTEQDQLIVEIESPDWLNNTRRELEAMDNLHAPGATWILEYEDEV